MSTSLNAVRSGAPTTGKKMYRKDVPPFGLFKINADGNVYMATGKRTVPPSEAGGVKVQVNGSTVYEVESRTPKYPEKVGDKVVIAYQALIVELGKGRTLDRHEDGAAVSFDPTANVTFLGMASIQKNW